MKEQTGIINNTCFLKAIQGNTHGTLLNLSKLPRIRVAIEQAARKWLPGIFAGSGIATICIAAIYLFLVQLAEYGF